MKKTVIISIFLLLSSAAGEGISRAAEVSFGGEVRTRAFYANNLSDAHNHGDPEVCPGSDKVPGSGDDTDCDDQEAFGDFRFRMRIEASQGIASGVAVVDFFSDNPGADAAALNTDGTGSTTGNHVLGGSGFGGSLDSVALKEAYLRVSWPRMNIVAGRQGISLGNGLVLDDSADAVSVAFPIHWTTLTFSQILLHSDDRGAQNTTAYLVNFNLAPHAKFKSGIFGLYLNDRGPNMYFGPNPFLNSCGPPGSANKCSVTGFGDDQLVLGVLGWSMDFNGSAFHWGTEIDHLSGTIRSRLPVAKNPSGESIDLGGLNMLVRFGWTGRTLDAELTGIQASGQDPGDVPPGGDKLNINALSPNFVLGNILVNNEGDSDRDGGNIGGLTAAKLALGWRPRPHVRFELAGILARLTEEVGQGRSEFLGYEGDLDLSVEIQPGLMWDSGIGVLFTGEAWKDVYNDPEARNTMVKGSTKLVFSF